MGWAMVASAPAPTHRLLLHEAYQLALPAQAPQSSSTYPRGTAGGCGLRRADGDPHLHLLLPELRHPLFLAGEDTPYRGLPLRQ